jgi:hypothetical protein
VRRFIVVHSSCGQVRGQCVEFSKKAKRNNEVRWGARGAGKLFVAWLPGGALDGGPKPALRELHESQGGQRRRRCERRGSLFAGYFTDFDPRGNSRHAGLAIRTRRGGAAV